MAIYSTARNYDMMVALTPAVASYTEYRKIARNVSVTKNIKILAIITQ